MVWRPLRSRKHHRPAVPAGPACFLALALTAALAGAEGVAVLKEQSYHRDLSAKAVFYRQIFASGPYVRLVTPRGNYDIFRSKLADRIEFPGPPPPFLLEDSDLALYRHSLASMQRFATRYPASASLLQPELDVVSGYVTRYDGGEVRHDGKWIAKEKLAHRLKTRQDEAESIRRREAEKVLENEARQDKGLVKINGTWVSRKEADERSPTASTQLSSTLWPLMNPNLEGAREALNNLAELARKQTGAAKVRTERLHTVIQNLFVAESRLSKEMIAKTAAEAQATAQDKQAEQWLKPNAFGTKRTEAARESKANARRIRRDSTNALNARRSQLHDQFLEVDSLTEDFYNLGEHRVALALGETLRAVAARRSSIIAYRSTFPDETLESIRSEITSRKK